MLFYESQRHTVSTKSHRVSVILSIWTLALTECLLSVRRMSVYTAVEKHFQERSAELQIPFGYRYGQALDCARRL